MNYAQMFSVFPNMKLSFMKNQMCFSIIVSNTYITTMLLVDKTFIWLC